MNDSLRVYENMDFENEKIKFESTSEVIICFEDIKSFRYKKSFNITNSLDKDGKYGKTVGTLDCIYGLSAMAILLS
tara:strand:+ start:362 stop:589 length:228 start_codon:yes stop_codon:yes gene_type:complete